MKAQSLIVVGINVIDNYMTAINVTSPTDIQEASRFDNTNLAGEICDTIEERYREKQNSDFE